MEPDASLAICVSQLDEEWSLSIAEGMIQAFVGETRFSAVTDTYYPGTRELLCVTTDYRNGDSPDAVAGWARELGLGLHDPNMQVTISLGSFDYDDPIAPRIGWDEFLG